LDELDLREEPTSSWCCEQRQNGMACQSPNAYRFWRGSPDLFRMFDFLLDREQRDILSGAKCCINLMMICV
jgi:hypothetical protein